MLTQGMQIDIAETSDADGAAEVVEVLDGGAEVIEVVQPVGTSMMKTSSGREVKKVSYADNSDDDDDDDYDASYINKHIAKAFHGKIYRGDVTKYNAGVEADGFCWHVVYEDGDEEDFDFEELQAAMALFESEKAKAHALPAAVPRSRQPGASAGQSRSRKKKQDCAKLCNKAKGITRPRREKEVAGKSFPRTKKGEACQSSIKMMNDAFNHGNVPANNHPGVFAAMDERTDGEGEDACDAACCF